VANPEDRAGEAKGVWGLCPSEGAGAELPLEVWGAKPEAGVLMHSV